MGNDITKILNKDTLKILKELRKTVEQGEFQQRVELVPLAQRIWDPAVGNKTLVLPPGTLQELLCAYCYPFLLYKQTVLHNRDLITKHSEMVVSKFEQVNTSLPQTISTMKKIHVIFPKEIQKTKDALNELNERIKKIQLHSERLMKFNQQLISLVENNVQPQTEKNMTMTTNQTENDKSPSLI